jgi:hypothetical protein
VLVDQVWLVCGLQGRQSGLGELVNHPETKNPAGFSGEQGSRKSVIYVRS